MHQLFKVFQVRLRSGAGITAVMDETPTSHCLDRFTPVVAFQLPDGTGQVSHQVAGAGARALAGVIDFMIQAVSFAGIAWLVAYSQPDLFPPGSWKWALPLGFAEWHIIYLMLFESFSKGRTPGLAAAGLQVISRSGGMLPASRVVLRNLARIFDLFLGVYAVSFWLMARSADRQSLGDRIADALVIYSRPLRLQMAEAFTPESFYSTSEAGYLLQAWFARNRRMDEDSKSASALDLSAYLQQMYEPDAADLPEPAVYLQNLFEKELAESRNLADPGSNAQRNSE